MLPSSAMLACKYDCPASHPDRLVSACVQHVFRQHFVYTFGQHKFATILKVSYLGHSDTHMHLLTQHTSF